MVFAVSLFSGAHSKRVFDRLSHPLLQFLYDIGVVSRKEPFQSLVNQGMILGEVRSITTMCKPTLALLNVVEDAKVKSGYYI